MFNLAVLAPDIVATILDETLPPELTLFDVAFDPPALWKEQRERTGSLNDEYTQGPDTFHSFY